MAGWTADSPFFFVESAEYATCCGGTHKASNARPPLLYDLAQ
jgi:hypothetical protein